MVPLAGLYAWGFPLDSACTMHEKVACTEAGIVGRSVVDVDAAYDVAAGDCAADDTNVVDVGAGTDAGSEATALVGAGGVELPWAMTSTCPA